LILALENGVADAPNERGGFPHVSGMKFYYDSTKAKQIIDQAAGKITSDGQRVVQAQIKNANGTYSVLDPNGYYMLATNSFTAAGGDFFYSLKQAKDAGRYYELFMPDYEVFLEHLDRVGNVNIGLEGRITDLKGQPLPGSNPDGGDTSTGGGTNPNPGTNPSDDVDATGDEVVVTLGAGDVVTETNADGKTIAKATVKAETLAAALEAAVEAGEGAKRISIEIPGTSEGIVQVRLPASALAAAGDDVVVSVSANGRSYDLPAKVLDVPSLASALGVDVEELEISVNIEALEGEDAAAVSDAASQVGGEMIGAPVAFTVTAEGDGKTQEVNDFGSTYVSRTMTLDASVDGAEATAVVYDPATGTMSFVPATFGIVDGKTVVTIKRNSNSVYAVVSASKSFEDVTNHWSEHDVELLAGKLIVQGQTDSAFRPDADITRAEFAALLVRSLGLKEDAAAESFGDVDAGDWYAGAVGAAAKAKLIQGFEDGAFRPDARITREQLATMIARALAAVGRAGEHDGEDAASAFVDGAAIQPWAVEAVALSAAAGIVRGTPDGLFEPAALATRAEATVMLKRLLTFADFIDG
jgi:flagellin-like hook-associated protein FlgL